MKRHVVIAGPFPPPVNGFAYITQEMAKAIAIHHDTRIINLSPGSARKGVRYHLRRMALTLRGIVPLLKGRRFPSRAFYVACEGNLGMLYTIKLCLVARLLGYPIFIHHHSFGYIEAHSRLMACLLMAAGHDATHIFLCVTMAERFAARYRVPIQSVIVSNSAFVAPMPLPANPPARRLTIGLLSNLNDEKGLSMFLDVLRGALAQGMDIAAVLAGPPQSDRERGVITAAVNEFKGRLDYRGPVYAEAKEDFFRSIDVFVFPTRYANEAQPTVLFEALAHGIPVLSYDRGCICSQAQHHGAVLERNGAFVPFALAWLARHIASPESLIRLRTEAREAFARDHAAAWQQAISIFDAPILSLPLPPGEADFVSEPQASLGNPVSEARSGTPSPHPLPEGEGFQRRIDIWHNILWSKYKGEVFSALFALAEKNEFDLKFFQIAETEGNRVGLSGIDLSHHRYPHELVFPGAYDQIGTLKRIAAILSRTWKSSASLTILAGYHRPEYWAQLFLIRMTGKKAAVFCDSTIHDNKPSLPRRILKRIFFSAVHGVFCYGKRSREYAAACGADPAYIFEPCQAAALPHDYSPERALARRLERTPSPQNPRYLYVGRLSPEKDIPTLLAAFAQAVARTPQATLVLVGSGPEREALETQARAHDITHAVTFAGSRSSDDLMEEYSRATCLILPSLSEPWGLVVNEALSYGCPVIVSDRCGCVPELVREGITGFTHRAGNAEDLLQKMIAAPLHFSDIGRTARDCLQVISHYSPGHAALRILDGIRKITANATD